ncbi:hypothetical protein GALL_380430 [mine drainage metagenome]|jgi:uncharacterized membrane protein|uniref:Uncharacterized protein n=1 Tax=mine drainage metagenome TaxID=410659 RepID=A0A1J5Q9Y9_9ZZZZ
MTDAIVVGHPLIKEEKLMRQLAKHELILVHGGLMPQDPTAQRNQGANPYTTTATCYPLVTGAAQIGGTIGAIGTVLATRNPAYAMVGFDTGASVAGVAVGFACETYMNAHSNQNQH